MVSVTKYGKLVLSVSEFILLSFTLPKRTHRYSYQIPQNDFERAWKFPKAGDGKAAEEKEQGKREEGRGQAPSVLIHKLH